MAEFLSLSYRPIYKAATVQEAPRSPASLKSVPPVYVVRDSTSSEEQLQEVLARLEEVRTNVDECAKRRKDLQRRHAQLAAEFLAAEHELIALDYRVRCREMAAEAVQRRIEQENVEIYALHNTIAAAERQNEFLQKNVGEKRLQAEQAYKVIDDFWAAVNAEIETAAVSSQAEAYQVTLTGLSLTSEAPTTGIGATTASGIDKQILRACEKFQRLQLACNLEKHRLGAFLKRSPQPPSTLQFTLSAADTQ